MKILKSKKGLSAVVTTLIILVVSVLLATVVTLYAVNVTTTRVEEESLQITKLHIWHNGTTFSEAAFLITNVGGRDVVIDKITVRGQECPWTSVYYSITTNEITSDLTYVKPNDNGTLLGKSWGSYSLTRASSDLTLRSGRTMIVFITNPDHISINDIGVTVGVTVFTSNAQYYKEANVQAYIS
ncbi:hypothetical protein H5T51_05240 [Candidatus Bathyarchaeota archaeon]|nr:hypothetical protein [Candidatus Bathyarchaeota archaeon]